MVAVMMKAASEEALEVVPQEVLVVDLELQVVTAMILEVVPGEASTLVVVVPMEEVAPMVVAPQEVSSQVPQEAAVVVVSLVDSTAVEEVLMVVDSTAAEDPHSEVAAAAEEPLSEVAAAVAQVDLVDSEELPLSLALPQQVSALHHKDSEVPVPQEDSKVLPNLQVTTELALPLHPLPPPLVVPFVELLQATPKDLLLVAVHHTATVVLTTKLLLLFLLNYDLTDQKLTFF